MKNISVSALAFSFIGSFLGAGYISGQELFQFFGAFGFLGVLGLFIAIAILSVFNLMIISIVKKSGNAQIDKTNKQIEQQNRLIGNTILKDFNVGV